MWSKIAEEVPKLEPPIEIGGGCWNFKTICSLEVFEAALYVEPLAGFHHLCILRPYTRRC